jgi:hypothetical protein
VYLFLARGTIGARKGMLVGVVIGYLILEYYVLFVASPLLDHESYGDDHPNFSYE